MKNILNITRPELIQCLESIDIKAFRAGQIFKWLYLKDAGCFEQMTDISKEMQQILARHFEIKGLVPEATERSRDGTEKFLFRLADGQYIESVMIPEKDHYTLCVSSQVGCAHNCRFCLTARGGFVRNLTVAEIISQIRDIRHLISLKKDAGDRKLSNIVFMGMGEPLANYDTLIKALDIILDSDFGMKFSSRHVTVSTCGLVPEIRRLGETTDVNLAISLNATDDATRSMLMPINKKYPLADLLEACRTFSMKPRKKITFEYILIKGINDSDDHARKLVRLLASIKAKINLIPFNEHDRSEFKRPDAGRVMAFLQILLDKQMTAIVRKSKGDDISAACGQLKAKLVD